MGETPTHLGKNRNTKAITSSAIVRAALSQYGTVDEDAVIRLIRNCREQDIDCTVEEIVDFVHEKGSMVKGRGSRIQNPIGFLIDAVPKCFSGGAIWLYRKAQNEVAAVENSNNEDRDREWGREHEADLLDPTVPEEVKQVIRRCLGIS